ncbi:MAG: PaaI family thioesterase [Hyphomicrobiales bacterium]|nr:PaaI family thioesterase [Hyphomicrobiales bacterium]
MTLDGAIEKRMRDSFAAQGLMKTFGAHIARLAPGECEIHLPFGAHVTQHHGFVHAGALTTILDNACGLAANTLMGPDEAALTIEFKVNFLRPARGSLFIARGRVRRAGKTVHVVEGELHAEHEEDRPTALMLATMSVVSGLTLRDS